MQKTSTDRKNYRVVILPGDGIGPEIMDATLEVLETVQKLSGRFALIYEFHQAGATCYRETGEPITPEALEAFNNTRSRIQRQIKFPKSRIPEKPATISGKLRPNRFTQSRESIP